MDQDAKTKNRVPNNERTKTALIRAGTQMYLLHEDVFQGKQGQVRTWRLSPVRAVVSPDNVGVESWERMFGESVKRNSGVQFDGLADAIAFARGLMNAANNYGKTPEALELAAESAKKNKKLEGNLQ